ncbi:MAG: hypothetical protein PG981_000351 [Wolbachia endosymbiont of Ctenocephalides orientis wCori]|nr:MAG: hypothetical protein PG981_000351 [Wolbachia endosymbiont of Ctenocephalides orientis wCori]
MNQVINALRNFPLCLPRTKKIQHEQKIAINLYTILGFRDSKDFENKVNTFNSSNVKDNAQCIQLRNELFYKFEKQVKKDKLKNNTAAKSISITAGESNDVENRLSNVLTLNQQAQDFLDKQHKNNITLNAIDSGVIVIDIQLKRPHAKKSKTLTSNKQDFEEVLEYITQLESKIGITLEELSECGKHSLKIFLLRYTKQLDKEYPQLRKERRNAIRVLVSDELRDLYDKSVQTGNLSSMPSYQACKELLQKSENSAFDFHGKSQHLDVLQNEQQISGKIKAPIICLQNEINIQHDKEDKLDTKQKELEEDLKHMKKLKAITNSVYKIAEHNVAISNCKDFQNSYLKEKEEHPLRSSYCQKMIDIFRKNIQGYQAQIDHIFSSVQEAFACISQKTKNLPDMKNFQAIINDVHKEHDIQQITKAVKSALCSLANVRNQIVSQNSGFLSDSSVYQHVNTGTEVTRM